MSWASLALTLRPLAQAMTDLKRRNLIQEGMTTFDGVVRERKRRINAGHQKHLLARTVNS
jgi:hypothetical protein